MERKELICKLAATAWKEGSAMKYGYSVLREGDVLSLAFRKKTFVKFEVTGYQQGKIVFEDVKSKAQEDARAAFVNYFQGNH